MTRFVCYIFTNLRTLLVCSRTFLYLFGSSSGSSRSVRLARGLRRILFGSFVIVTSRTRTKFVHEFTSRTLCSRAWLGSGVISGATGTTSEPSTPVKALSPVEMKKMGKEINSVAKVVEVVYMAVNAFSENNVETDQVLDYLKDVIEKGVSNLRVFWVCSQ